MATNLTQITDLRSLCKKFIFKKRYERENVHLLFSMSVLLFDLGIII